MKLLFDNNLSPRLVNLLAESYPGSVHVRDLGMERASDTDVWRHAAASGLTIVTKDSDFHERSLIFGAPPKVVWLRLGNCTVAESAALLHHRVIELRRFVEASSADYLVLS